MAIFPCRLAISPRSSSTFTANTVLEKLSANPTNKALCQLKSTNIGTAKIPSSNIKLLNNALLKIMCRVAGAHTWGLIKLFTLSFKPILNKRSVTPSAAMVSSSSVLL